MNGYTWRYGRNDYTNLPKWILVPNGIGNVIASIEMLEDGSFEIYVTHQLEREETLKSAKAAAEAFFEEHKP